jgi:hypothetical protein
MREFKVTDKAINEAFKRSNFGARETTTDRKQLMVECILKYAAGFGDGSTITGICQYFGLLTPRRTPRKAAIRWAYMQIYKNGTPTQGVYKDILKKGDK